MSYRKEIRIFWQKGVPRKHYKIAKKAAKAILQSAKVDDEISVKRGGKVKLSKFRKRKGKFSGSLDGEKLINSLAKRWGLFAKKVKYYTVILVRDDTFFKSKGKKYDVLGLGQASSGIAVVVVADNTESKKDLQYTIIHELGHVFGLVPDDRKKAIKMSFGHKHCKKVCAMYPNSKVSPKLRMKSKIFCKICISNLKDFFND